MQHEREWQKLKLPLKVKSALERNLHPGSEFGAASAAEAAEPPTHADFTRLLAVMKGWEFEKCRKRRRTETEEEDPKEWNGTPVVFLDSTDSCGTSGTISPANQLVENTQR